MLGEAQTVVSGGMENLSQAPHVLRGMRDTYKLARPPKAETVLEKDMEDYLFTNLLDGMCGSFMAQTSDEICKRKGVTREETDEFAALSHSRVVNSIENNTWEQEIVKVGDIGHKDEDHVVHNCTKESLAELRTAFGPESLVTAGNASGVVDGAAAVVIKSASKAKQDGDKPLAKIISWGIVGLEPAIMAYGPVPSSKKALEKAGLTIDDIDRWEINEAFAGQAVADPIVTQSTSNVTTKGETETTVKSPPPSAISPSINSSNSDLCTVGVAGAVQTQILGISGGATVRDMNCERLKLAKTIYDMGMKVAAVSIMCQDTRVFNAMEMAGTPCPFRGKIGEEAQAEWDAEENKELKPGAKEEEQRKNDKLEGAAMGVGASLLLLLLL